MTRQRDERRRLNRTLRWAGLALCALVAIAWLAGMWWLVIVRVSDALIVFSGEGSITGVWYPAHLAAEDWPGRLYFGPSSRSLDWWGFRYRSRPSAGVLTTAISFPQWLPLLLAAAPTALAWRSDFVRRRRRRINHCTICGYNLVGLKAEIACPECGSLDAAARK